jgi:prevent-host-death family protein
MQKSLSELASLPESELSRLVEREPVLITANGEPTFVAQSLHSFEEMVRRIRKLEAAQRHRTEHRGKLILLR